MYTNKEVHYIHVVQVFIEVVNLIILIISLNEVICVTSVLLLL